MSTRADLLSIARVSAATGIAVETLRMWERRYGKPEPERRPSGHRRYTPRQVQWLGRVAEAIARGHRPSRVLGLSERALEQLVGRSRPEPAGARATRRILDLTRRFAERRIVTVLEREARRLGHQRFILERVVPLLSAVGSAWERGEIDIRHEHFLSEILEDLVRALRRRLGPARNAPLVVLATLPGERHGLGLLAASFILTLAGVRTRRLGTETPVEEIVAAVEETDARAVAISVSLATCSVETERMIADLRAALPRELCVIAGGEGARRLRKGVRGVEYFPSLGGFRHWLSSRPLGASKSRRRRSP